MQQQQQQKNKLDREGILRSQNNKTWTSEEDEEIMALIDERRKVNEEDKERLKEVRRSISASETRKDPEDKENDTHPKNKKEKGEVITSRKGVANVFGN